jgi:ribosomal protein S18 acetylase RimI-like enzyme
MDGEAHYSYRGTTFPDPGIGVVEYRPEFFLQALELESDCLGELRKKNGITPHRISDSGRRERNHIANFFMKHRSTYLFLFRGAELVGTIMFMGNRIQSLCVAPKYQRQGYGSKLTALVVNRILELGHESVELDVLPGNAPAEKLYRRLGFVHVGA